MFHEFGHALHGLFSDVKYPSLSGTAVPRDFVEFPSQYNEMWARDPKVFAHYAKHYQTGEAMPKALLDKVIAAEKFGQGYATTEYIAAAMLDQAWHQMSAARRSDGRGSWHFEADALKKSGVEYAPVPPRYSHAVLPASVRRRLLGRLLRLHLERSARARYREVVPRCTADCNALTATSCAPRCSRADAPQNPEMLFEQFYGGPPDVGPLLEHRGLQ